MIADVWTWSEPLEASEWLVNLQQQQRQPNDVTAGFMFSSATELRVCWAPCKKASIISLICVRTTRAERSCAHCCRQQVTYWLTDGTARHGPSNSRHLYAGVRPIRSDTKRALSASIFCRVSSYGWGGRLGSGWWKSLVQLVSDIASYIHRCQLRCALFTRLVQSSAHNNATWRQWCGCWCRW